MTQNNFQSTQEVTLKESKMAQLMFLKHEKEVLYRVILELLQQAVEFHVEPWPNGIYYVLYVREEHATLLQTLKTTLVDASLGHLGQVLSGQNLPLVHSLPGQIIQRVRRMTPAELEAKYWYPDSDAVAIELAGSTLLYPAQDEEGNGPGVLFAQTADGQQVLTLHIDREKGAGSDE